MANVNLIVDQDIFDLFDTDYVERNIPADVYITFACVEPNNRKDDKWIGDDGKQSFLIALPYEQIKQMEVADVRVLMLQKAQERLQQAA